ncbi:hypothetical protein [Microcoleus sp. F4-D5]|uniref:hypothetical protein n=1 Tax=Microcoleus sp. F4-D5 TaxID=2818760 RepID=UPI002FD3F655
MIYATAKVSIDSPGILDASTGLDERQYFLLGDRSKLKNRVYDSKECIQDGFQLLRTQVNAASDGKAIEQPVDWAIQSLFLWYVKLRCAIYIF